MLYIQVNKCISCMIRRCFDSVGHCPICSPLGRIITITTLQRNHWRRHNPLDPILFSRSPIQSRLVATGGSGVPTGSTTPLFLSTNVLGLCASVTLSGTVGGAMATQLDHYDQRNKELTPSGQRRDGSCDDVEIGSGRRRVYGRIDDDQVEERATPTDPAPSTTTRL